MSQVKTPARNKVDEFHKKYTHYKPHFPDYIEPVTYQNGAMIQVGNKELINFTTYDYHGFSCLSASSVTYQQELQNTLRKWGGGAQGVRLLGGNLSVFNELEQVTARFLHREQALLVSSGYIANITLIQAIARAYDKCTLLTATKNHQSILDGCALASQHSDCTVLWFDHKNLDHLEQQLAQLKKQQSMGCQKIIISDSIFSMDGDIVDLPRLLQLRETYPDTQLIIDESHSLGVAGHSGQGIEQHFNIKEGEGADFITSSLSKAINTTAGIIATSTRWANWLRFHANAYIFSASPSPIAAVSAIHNLQTLEDRGEEFCLKLHNNIRYLHKALDQAAIPFQQTCGTPITYIPINNELEAFTVTQHCFDSGLYVLPVAWPAVQRGRERLRLTITGQHSQEAIDQGVSILQQVLVPHSS